MLVRRVSRYIWVGDMAVQTQGGGRVDREPGRGGYREIKEKKGERDQKGDGRERRQE